MDEGEDRGKRSGREGRGRMGSTMSRGCQLILNGSFNTV